MASISELNTELAGYVEDVEDIKEKVQDIAEAKDISITRGTDTPLSVLNKINSGTIKTPTATLNITTNNTYNVTNYASVEVNVVENLDTELNTQDSLLTNLETAVNGLDDAGYPIEIDDPNDMTALLVAGNVGKVYLYTGATTQDYINGDLYMVEAVQRTITSTLVNCTSDNNAATILDGSSYTAIITADDGFTLIEAPYVSILMGNTDITSTAYNNGVISIASVSGDIVINIQAKHVFNGNYDDPEWDDWS